MFEEMKAAIENDEIDGQFGYDCFEDEVNDAYSRAWDKLKEHTRDTTIYIEPSIQCGRGIVEMSSQTVGKTEWDFESECDLLYDLAAEAISEASFVDSIFSFLLDKYEECAFDDDDDYYDEDDEYEGCEEDDEEDY